MHTKDIHQLKRHTHTGPEIDYRFYFIKKNFKITEKKEAFRALKGRRLSIAPQKEPIVSDIYRTAKPANGKTRLND